MAAADDVGQGQPRDRHQPRRGGGILHTESRLHGHRREAEEQEARGVLDHHQAPERFLASRIITPSILFIFVVFLIFWCT